MATAGFSKAAKGAAYIIQEKTSVTFIPLCYKMLKATMSSLFRVYDWSVGPREELDSF